jgi:hypothetical protein
MRVKVIVQLQLHATDAPFVIVPALRDLASPVEEGAGLRGEKEQDRDQRSNVWGFHAR